MATKLYIAAENIPADAQVGVMPGTEHAYRIIDRGMTACTFIGIAAENLREGFRIAARHDGVFEDDA